MKKIAALLIVFTMIFALAACGKKEDTPTAAEPTKAAEVTKEPETTKEAETTLEAEKDAEVKVETETTPGITDEPEVTDEPIEDPGVTEEPAEVEEPDVIEDIDDEFYNPAGDEFDGLWESAECVLYATGEGSAEVIRVFFGRNYNTEEWNSYFEFYTHYSVDDKTFTSQGGSYVTITDGLPSVDFNEDTCIFTVEDDELIWTTYENMVFTRADGSSWSIDTDFASNLRREDVYPVDIVGSDFCGIYCENTKEPDNSYYFEYSGSEKTFDTMDEFDCAYLHFAADETEENRIIFLEKGINNTMDWTISWIINEDFGTLEVTVDGKTYYGDFYWGRQPGEEYGSLFICLHIDEFNIWLV